MDLPKAPVGIIAKVALWLKDFALMPGRIRVLAEAAEGDRDARPICTSCGTGRVGDLERLSNPGWYRDRVVGTCSELRNALVGNGEWNAARITGERIDRRA